MVSAIKIQFQAYSGEPSGVSPRTLRYLWRESNQTLRFVAGNRFALLDITGHARNQSIDHLFDWIAMLRTIKKNEELLLLLSLLTNIAIWSYLWILILRTQFLTRQTSIGSDVIWIIHILTDATFLGTAYLTLRVRPLPFPGVVSVILGVANIVVFVSLLASGRVGDFVGIKSSWN